MRYLKLLTGLAFALGLAACGGGSDEPLPEETVQEQSIGSGTFKAGTHLLSASDTQGSTLTEDTLTVRKPQSATYAVGDVLVVDDHGGRLIKITSVQVTDDTIVYGHTPASLAQAFDTLDVNLQGELSPQDLGERFETGDPELELAWAEPPVQGSSVRASSKAVSADTNVLELKFKRLGAQVGSGIEIDGGASFKLNPDFGLKLEKAAGETLPQLALNATLNPDLKATIALASKYGGQVSYTLDKDFPLKPIRRIIIVPIFGVPTPVPFWIKPVISVAAAVNGTAGSQFTQTYNYGVAGRFGVEKPAQADWDGIGEVSSSSSLEVSDVDGELGVNIQVPKLEFQFLIYSAAGPNFEVVPEAGLTGKGGTQGTPAVEGVVVDGNIKVSVAAGLKGGLDFGNIDAVKSLLGDVSFSFSPISLKLFEGTLFEKQWFFPYQGQAAVTVYDNGSAPDDIFEVSLDGVQIGFTNKGGSGQFRLKNLRPGDHTLTVKTVEDDSPPGTYAISLNEGITFSDGSTSRFGTASLNQSVNFTIVVPKTP